jgi:hypothetical protein
LVPVVLILALRVIIPEWISSFLYYLFAAELTDSLIWVAY